MITNRPQIKTDYATRHTFGGGCNVAVTRGLEVKFGATDDVCVLAGANDPLGIGIVEQAVATVGHSVTIICFGNCIMDVTVGTGGATRGTDAITVANGFTDAAANGGGTTSQIIKGRFMQTGVAGDIVGLLMNSGRSVSA
jgi:hypothetical protein